MSVLPPATTDLRALLESAEAAAPTQAVEVATQALAEMVGARQVSFLIADLSGRAVVRFGQPGARDARSRETLQLDGTAYDQVLRTQQAELSRTGDGARLIAPVTDRGDAIGLLELLLPCYPTDQVVADVVAVAHALAYIVVANRRHTDLFEWGQRSTPFSLAAEIQRRLLPSSFTCEAGQFTISAWMEPASSVGGDTFDYVLGEDALQLSITDAAGHDVAAALLATLLVGSLRNGRRGGLALLEQACAANDALAAHSSVGQFVTGQLVRIDLHTRSATVVNAGHPFPLRLRGGVVEEIELDIDFPFGIEEGRPYRLQEFPIAPGDRIVFLTDGMLERNAAEVDVAEVLAGSGDLHPREVVRALGAAVLRATGGELRDDATVMCLDWYGGPPRLRDSSGGASLLRASP